VREDDKPLDDAPGALYRALPRDEPPQSIDTAVLAAARRSVEKRSERKWAAPVALAAVLVLSIGVTLRVAEERPDSPVEPVAPPSTAPAGAQTAAPQVHSPAATMPRRAKPAERQAAPIAAKPPVDEPARPENVQREPEPNPGSAPATREERSAGALSARERTDAPQAAPPTAIVPSSASVSAPAPSTPFVPSPRADSAPMMAKSATAESSLAAVQAPKSPEAWLERIAELRAQGRHKEADESYAQFLQRFPGYTIAPEMLRKIAPPR